MKKNFAILILALLFLKTIRAQSDHANQIASKIAQKMKDSLKLTGQQKNNIKNINLGLDAQKINARQQHAGVLASSYIQKIENTRDSLYKLVLPPEKYLLYKQKKRNLVNNN